ncbi:uncharacterized protein [Misgurnus anguillicaudatus]|uniref:uncharacterized protein n=1 Tax=Misgurnus anguillicaudatus TaxID=75329 RepID=UPI003CCEFE9F
MTCVEKRVERSEQSTKICMTRVWNLESYGRRWNLRLHRLQETAKENVREVVIRVCQKVLPHEATIPDALDVAQRTGFKHSNESRPRAIIIAFIARRLRDALWKAAKSNEFLKNQGLQFIEDLTKKDRDRQKLWPLIKKAREEDFYAFDSVEHQFIFESLKKFTEVFSKKKESVQFLVNLFTAASEFKTNTDEKYTELFTSVCSYTTFPCDERTSVQSNFLLDLYSHLKDYESQTGSSVLPALQSIYQSSPAVWTINLSERKTSILLEVLKLQTEKKPVELIDCTDDESEVRGFIQCLPYISQLRLPLLQNDHFKFTDWRLRISVLDMCLQVPILQKEITETSTDILYSYISNGSCNFLLNLYQQIKVYETQTGRDVFPVLQVFFKSTPAVWIINLSERKTSILLEVLKLQTEKKPVELIDWTDDESEVRGFIQCLPYISQLR